MKTYIIDQHEQKTYFEGIPKGIYFGVGAQDSKDYKRAFIFGYPCTLYSLFWENGSPVYNETDSENGKENYEINFENVKLTNKK